MIVSRVAERIPLSALAIAILAVTGSVIAMGGMIRIYDAGESCPDWPTCFGTWGFDVSEEDQESWWEANPDEIDSRGLIIDTQPLRFSQNGFTGYWQARS